MAQPHRRHGQGGHPGRVLRRRGEPGGDAGDEVAPGALPLQQACRGGQAEGGEEGRRQVRDVEVGDLVVVRREGDQQGSQRSRRRPHGLAGHDLRDAEHRQDGERPAQRHQRAQQQPVEGPRIARRRIVRPAPGGEGPRQPRPVEVRRPQGEGIRLVDEVGVDEAGVERFPAVDLPRVVVVGPLVEVGPIDQLVVEAREAHPQGEDDEPRQHQRPAAPGRTRGRRQRRAARRAKRRGPGRPQPPPTAPASPAPPAPPPPPATRRRRAPRARAPPTRPPAARGRQRWTDRGGEEPWRRPILAHLTPSRPERPRTACYQPRPSTGSGQVGGGSEARGWSLVGRADCLSPGRRSCGRGAESRGGRRPPRRDAWLPPHLSAGRADGEAGGGAPGAGTSVAGQGQEPWESSAGGAPRTQRRAPLQRAPSSSPVPAPGAPPPAVPARPSPSPHTAPPRPAPPGILPPWRTNRRPP